MRKIFLLVSIYFCCLCCYGQQPKIVLPVGHTEKINTANFSADEKRIVTASEDGTAKLWDVQTGALLADLKAHKNNVYSAFFSPDNKKIITASADATAKVWDANTGILLFSLQGRGTSMEYANFSPDGQKIVTISTGAFWDNQINKIRYTAPIKIWNAQKGAFIKDLKSSKGCVYDAFFSPDSKRLLTVSTDTSAKIWDINKGVVLKKLKISALLRKASFSQNGKYILAVLSNGTADIWDSESGSLIKKIEKQGWSTDAALFSPDGRYFITCSSRELSYSQLSIEGKISIWDIKSGMLVTSISEKGYYSNSVLFNEESTCITIVNINSIVKWSIPDGKLIDSLSGDSYYDFDIDHSGRSFSRLGKYIACYGGKSVAIYDLNTGEIVSHLNSKMRPINSFFSPDNKYIIQVGNGINIFDISTGALARTMNDTDTKTAFYSADNKDIITISYTDGVKVWDAANGSLLRRLFYNDSTDILTNNITDVIYDKFDRYIITFSGTTEGRIWDKKTGEFLLKLEMSTRGDDHIYISYSAERQKDIPDSVIKYVSENMSLSDQEGKNGFSNRNERELKHTNSKYYVTSGKDGNLNLLDSKGKLVRTLYSNGDQQSSPSFSPDGKYILSTNGYATQVWDPSTGKELYSVSSVLGHDYLSRIPSGYYECSPDAAKQLHYVTKDLKVITFEQLDIKYNRPDKVLENAGCTDTALIRSYKMAYYKRIRKLGIDTLSFSNNYSVPESDFTNRNSISYQQNNDLLTLHIFGKDNLFLLERFNVFVNGSPVYGLKGINLRQQSKHLLDTTIIIALSQGSNLIETSVTNVNGIESYRMPLSVNYIPLATATQKVYFIGIGANHFVDSQYNLKYCVKDIKDLSVRLKEKYGDHIEVHTFFNKHVITDSIIALKKYLLHTTVNDKVIIAYSGHGLLSSDYDYYLSTYNINFSKPEEGGLPYDVLESLLDSIPARQKLLLIDACNSGEVDKDELVQMHLEENKMIASAKGIRPFISDNARLSTKNTFELMQHMFVNVGRNTGATVISAAAGTQFALEKSDLENGVFTYSILEYMKLHEHTNVKDLKQYVNKRVIELTNGLQVPTARSENLEYDWQVW